MHMHGALWLQRTKCCQTVAQSFMTLFAICFTLFLCAMQATDAEGQPLTYLTIVCKPEDGDDVAAALLQVCCNMVT
jgi:hypothetical protein